MSKAAKARTMAKAKRKQKSALEQQVLSRDRRELQAFVDFVELVLSAGNYHVATYTTGLRFIFETTLSCLNDAELKIMSQTLNGLGYSCRDEERRRCVHGVTRRSPTRPFQKQLMA
jgi:hypothetical protein